jgi:hypothetical protein
MTVLMLRISEIIERDINFVEDDCEEDGEDELAVVTVVFAGVTTDLAIN